MTWRVDTLTPGDSRVVWINARSDQSAMEDTLAFLVDVTATDTKSADAQGSVAVAEFRAMDLQLVARTNPVGPSKSIRFSLHYGARSIIDDARLRLVIP